MKCSRCNGFMLHEQYQEGTDRFLAFRCVLCGDVLDEIILHHRYRRRRDVIRNVIEKTGI